MAEMNEEDWEVARPLVKKIGEAVNHLLESDTELDQAIEDLKHAGFGVIVSVEISLGIHKKDAPQTSSPKLRVRNGQIPPGMFKSKNDKKFLKTMNIKLDE